MTPYFESQFFQFLDLLPSEPSPAADPPRGDVECRAEAMFLEDRCGSCQIADIPVVERQDDEFVWNWQEMILFFIFSLRRECL